MPSPKWSAAVIRKLACTAALLSVCAVAPALADNCDLKRAASIDMKPDAEGGMTVPISIGGRSQTLLVDTGGVDSMLTESTARSLGLVTHDIRNVRLTMFGGAAIDRYANAEDVLLGGLHADRLTFLIMPDGHLASGVVGTLAPDILRAYDDDFDFANAKLNLFQKDHCEGRVVYWSSTADAIPFRMDRYGHIYLPVSLDGKELRISLDTGSTRSILSLDTMEGLFGFRESSPDLKVAEKYGDAKFYKYPFKSMTFGNVVVSNPDILLVPDSTSHIPSQDSALIGIGILRQLHLYIAYGEQKLYVTGAADRN
jgi:predicted aspartyl protease